MTQKILEKLAGAHSLPQGKIILVRCFIFSLFLMPNYAKVTFPERNWMVVSGSEIQNLSHEVGLENHSLVTKFATEDGTHLIVSTTTK